MTETHERWRLGHRPALDGLRGVAILLVVSSHALMPRWTTAGPVGVTVFFTLSGFLITSLLLQEQEAGDGRISLKRFYLRRAARLLPALAAFIGMLVLLSVAVRFPLVRGRDVLAVATYSVNWVQIIENEGLPRLIHLWSLSVEEQFYVVWPLVMVACARWGRRGLTWAALVFSVGAVIERVALYDAGATSSRIYYGTDARADSLLVGCALALYLHGRRERRNRPALALAVACLFVPLSLATGVARALVVPTVVPLVTAAVIYLVAQTGAVRWLTGRCLVLVGRRSYALYLWHAIFVEDFQPLVARAMPGWLAMCVCLAAAWGVTLVSWRYVEEPVLAAVHGRRERTDSRGDPAPAAA